MRRQAMPQQDNQRNQNQESQFSDASWNWSMAFVILLFIACIGLIAGVVAHAILHLF
jgi:hypothetical protein